MKRFVFIQNSLVMKINYLLLIAFLLLAIALQAQCDLNPPVYGDPLLCPDEEGMLYTDTFDTYQWYRTPWGSNDSEAIPGATAISLVITEDDLLYRIHVEVTLDTCTAESEKVLVDGWVFLPPYVIHHGDYTFDPNEEVFVVCEGDTMWLELGMPYTESISWIRDGSPIPGEHSTILTVTEAGEYTVEAAPGPCPRFILPLGIILPVVIEDCSTSVEPSPSGSWRMYPNPVGDMLQLEGESVVGRYLLVSMDGKPTGSYVCPDNNCTLDLSAIPSGMYYLLKEDSNAPALPVKVTR